VLWARGVLPSAFNSHLYKRKSFLLLVRKRVGKTTGSESAVTTNPAGRSDMPLTGDEVWIETNSAAPFEALRQVRSMSRSQAA
jgi:hypothetical protein